ncbi:MAG: NAD-dependent epimerase/dehydratase family protein [Chloroflexi bacterium]|nr:NAD-dependent epimerase/dehydratase family protein [Chloroflexota bacterium]
MTTIAITGATGFIGGALARALAAQGDEIVALARPSASRDHLADLPITWVSGDVTDRDSLRGQFDGANWLIHAGRDVGTGGRAGTRLF